MGDDGVTLDGIGSYFSSPSIYVVAIMGALRCKLIHYTLQAFLNEVFQAQGHHLHPPATSMSQVYKKEWLLKENED